MWHCTEHTRKYDALTKKKDTDVIFWTYDSNRDIVSVVVPKRCMPVVSNRIAQS